MCGLTFYGLIIFSTFPTLSTATSRKESLSLLGRLKAVLQFLDLSLNDNDPLLHLAPGSLVHHRHVSTTVRAKRLVGMVALWMVIVMRMRIVWIDSGG